MATERPRPRPRSTGGIGWKVEGRDVIGFAATALVTLVPLLLFGDVLPPVVLSAVIFGASVAALLVVLVALHDWYELLRD